MAFLSLDRKERFATAGALEIDMTNFIGSDSPWPRTVASYLYQGLGRKPDPQPRWTTFVRNYAQALVSTDFFVVTASFSSCLG
jgi:hypothetical protein